MQPVRRALKFAVKAAAAGADRLRPPTAGLVVLLYHRVGAGTGLEVDLDPSVFGEQMATLSERAVSLAEGLALLTAPAGPANGAAPVVVTFDDGTADFADVAVPIIERHRIPVTLYAATAFIEEGREFPGGGQALSWGALADACATGLVDVGSHTHRHRLLDRLPAIDVADELDRSTGLVGDRLGRVAADFAYPKAVPGSPAAQQAVRARFRSAALAGTRANPFGEGDPFALARSPIQVSDGLTWFRRKAAGGLRLEDALRQRVDRRRYADATA